MCLETYDKELDNISYRTYRQRLNSFANWKGKLTPEELAKAGFYFTSISDICKCYYCGLEIFQWTEDDCPIIEHYKYNYKKCDLAECLWFSASKNFKIPKEDLVSKQYKIVCYGLGLGLVAVIAYRIVFNDFIIINTK